MNAVVVTPEYSSIDSKSMEGGSSPAAVGAVVAVVAVVAIALFVRKRNQDARARQQQQNTPQAMMPVVAGQPQIQAAAQLMDVQVPAGMTAGSSFQVATPTGEQFAVQVPQGAGPGTIIRVPIPAAIPAANQVPNVPVAKTL